jgi:uncharacterized protein YycO
MRAVMWSDWSHCAIIDGNNVIEAAMIYGVRERPLADLLMDASKWSFIDIPADDSDAIIAAARSRIGRAYDWMGALALLLHIDLHREQFDFCSELVAWSFKQGGTPLFRTDAWRIMPRDIYIRNY